MINYFNFGRFDDRYLVTNDLGYYMFLDDRDFQKLLFDKITVDDERYSEFTEKGFIYKGHADVFAEKFRCEMENSKNYLYSATSLHIFVVILTVYIVRRRAICERPKE